MVAAWKRVGPALLLIALAALITAPLTRPVESAGSATLVAGADDRPNIVLVMTDDQNDYDLQWMPLTREALQADGIEFTDAISPHPLCCPARAELVTGQYAQNNGVRHNAGPHGGFAALDSADTIGAWFTRAGYQTGFVGKYLNGYQARHGAEPGWTRWDALTTGVYDYRDFGFYNDGRGQDLYRDAYVTDAIAERTNEMARELSSDPEPFLLYSFHVAPHYRFDKQVATLPPAASPRVRGRFADARPPSLDKPSFGERRVADQPRVLRNRRVPERTEVRAWFRARVASLQAVDRAVSSLVRTLQQAGEWDNTYLFFTSDNGYALGEHRLMGKNVLVEEAMQVPLLVHGPGIAGGTTSQAPATLVDLPATFADLAGLRPGRVVDGASLVPYLTGRPGDFRDTTLVQTGRSDGDGWDYRGVRTSRYLYAVSGAFSGDGADGADVVLYDGERDPWQLVNRAEDPAYAEVRARLEERRAQLIGCAGWSCNRAFGELPTPLEVTGDRLPRRSARAAKAPTVSEAQS